jgi:hypothetical protein
VQENQRGNDMFNLPPPAPPFMVQPTFEIKADLFPLPSTLNGRYEEKHFIEDTLLGHYISKRLELFEKNASDRRAIQTDDEVGLAKTVWRVFDIFASEYPQLIQKNLDGLVLNHLGLRLIADTLERKLCPKVVLENPTELGQRVAKWLEQQTGVTRLLDALCLSCQEDIVIMRDIGETGHYAEALSVCFPSGWDPREKLLGNFSHIHAPIAENERLLKSGSNIMKALFTKGPFIRFSWGLTLNSQLDNHPETPKGTLPDLFFDDPNLLARHVYLRMERQTTFPFPELQRGLFSIRVYVNPLTERVKKEPELRERLATLLHSVKSEVLAYKGMARLTPPIVAWLESEEVNHDD